MKAMVNIAGLVGSRICHDLSSPLGAIANGLELMDLSGHFVQNDEYRLVSESCAHANAKLKFLRLAYGLASDAREIAPREISDILKSLYYQARWSPACNVKSALVRHEAQMLFLALQCFESVTRLDGLLRITCDKGQLRISAELPKPMSHETLWGALQTGAFPDDLSADMVHFPFLRQLCFTHSYSMRLSGDAHHPCLEIVQDLPL